MTQSNMDAEHWATFCPEWVSVVELFPRFAETCFCETLLFCLLYVFCQTFTVNVKILHIGRLFHINPKEPNTRENKTTRKGEDILLCFIIFLLL